MSKFMIAKHFYVLTDFFKKSAAVLVPGLDRQTKELGK